MLLLSTLLSCNSVRKTYVTNNNLCQYDDPIFNISKGELRLHDTILKQLKTLEKNITLIDNNVFLNEYKYYKDELLTNKQTNKQLNVSKYLRYTHQGLLKWVEFEYDNGYKNIYNEIDYDENGNIINTLDYEKGYNICYAEAIAIVKKVAKRKIKKYQITAFNLPFRVDLNKFPNEKPEWGITLANNEDYHPKVKKVYWINGVTGKFLKTSKIYITP